MPASNASASTVTDTTDREIILQRVFDAPRELVFEAWTSPKHLIHWWGPNGFTTTIREMDVRPGGDWRLVMRGPDGRDYFNRIVFVEIEKPVRLVYKHVPEPGSEPVSFETTVTFAAHGKKTEVTLHMVFPTAAVREHVVTKYGALEGGKQTLARLAAHLPAMQYGELLLERVFDAPRAMVFEAFRDPARLKHWWGPRGFTNPVCEADARPGGTMRIHMQAPDGAVYPMTGFYHEVAAPERIAFTTSALDAKGNSMFDVLHTITFAEEGRDGSRTRLTLRANVAAVHIPEAGQYLKDMEQGWSLSLERLEFEVIEKAAVLVITRDFDAPRDLVWKAVVEPERLMHWWGPKGFTSLTCKVDLRPGGLFHYSMKAPNGIVMWGRWVYRIVDAPERLASVVAFSDENGDILPNPIAPVWPREVMTSMLLTEQGGKTRMTLRSYPINASGEEIIAFQGSGDSMRKGYAGTLDQLEAYMAQLAQA